MALLARILPYYVNTAPQLRPLRDPSHVVDEVVAIPLRVRDNGADSALDLVALGVIEVAR
jgi:hypothetical protein